MDWPPRMRHLPKLTIIAACDRVIFDRVGIASLINIFQRLEIAASPTAYPAEAVSPIRWSVFTQWHHQPVAPGTPYTQHAEVLKPNGEVFIETRLPFLTDDNPYTRHQLEIMGLPLGHEGTVTVRVWLDGLPDSMGEYYIDLKYTKTEPQKEEAAVIINEQE